MLYTLIDDGNYIIFYARGPRVKRHRVTTGVFFLLFFIFSFYFSLLFIIIIIIVTIIFFSPRDFALKQYT